MVRITSANGCYITDCDEETFELAKIYLRDGRSTTEVVAEFRRQGIPFAIALVLQAQRQVDSEPS